ncbi:MAG: B12-binding domain-containing radical SAM protein [Chloroflexi bacterium]|nr:B12-binding domain-containing radical SAM protein [Chloroflexota bacterium]
MKLLLIFPPQEKAITPRFKTCLQDGIGFLPPLGLLSLATYIEHKGLAEVEVIDCPAGGISHNDLPEKIRVSNADIVGISAMTHTLADVFEAAGAVKNIDPGLPVIMGGPHTSLFPVESANMPGVDYVVMGDGEIPLAGLLEALRDGRDPAFVPGVIKSESGEIKGEPKPYFTEDLDSIPPPERRFLPAERYYTVVSRHPPTTIIISSRGCPHSCIFCHTAGGKRWRGRSAAHVAYEISACTKEGISEFFFFDENFLFSRDRIIELASEIRKRKLEIFFDLRTRADSVDAELLKILRSVGTQRIQFGLESGSPRMLKSLKKGFLIEQSENAVRQARNAGLATYASFMIGLPGETAEDLRATLDFALRLPLDYVDFSIAMPYPYTEMYTMAREKSLIKGDPWREFAANPDPGFVIPYWEERLSREELEEELGSFFRKFYLRPGYMARSLFSVRSPGELFRKARAGVRVIFKI